MLSGWGNLEGKKRKKRGEMGWYSVIVKLEDLQERRRKDGGEKARRCRCERRCESCVGQVKVGFRECGQQECHLWKAHSEHGALL